MQRKRIATITGGIIAVLFAATAAMAWWTTDGGGTGTAEVSTPEDVTITAGTVTSYLFPTGEVMGDLAVTVTNPNDYDLRIYEIDLDTDEGVGGYSQNAVDCYVTFTDQTTTEPWIVPGSDSLDIDLVDSVSMGADAPDECQNEDFTIYVKTGTEDA